MTILESNRMIAEFMDLIPIKSGTKSMGNIAPPEIPEALLKYESSWDALMPVIEKISKIPLIDGDKPCTDPIDTCYPITFNMPTPDGEVMFRFKGGFLSRASTLIEAAYNAVVEFLQHYNEKP
jgi:hypothetical protein